MSEQVLKASSGANTYTIKNDEAGSLLIQKGEPAVTVGTINSTGIISANTEESLTNFYTAQNVSGYQDLYRSGWLPSWFNQQWGGSQWGMLPDGSFGSVATGNVQDDNVNPVGAAAGSIYGAQSFKCSESISGAFTVWLKLYKVGNPVNVISVAIYSDNGSGSPNAALGSGDSKTAKLITSKTDGEWYAFTVAPGTITAGTKYHIVLVSTATDASNYYVWKATGTSKYPHGFVCNGTSTPTWTQFPNWAACFLIQNTSATSILQSGGMFDYKLAFNNGSPINQSRSVAQPLANFYDGKIGTVLYRGTFSAGSAVMEYSYGIDHDRIFMTIDGSGYPRLYIARSDRTLYSITGTVAVTSGSHDVGFKIRTVGDGADYAYLYVDGVSTGTPLTSQTFSMSPEFARLGTARLGDAILGVPTWTQDMQMTSLPSAQGWTWGGTGTEANCMSIQNNKLYQNANGYTSTQSGYYAKPVALNNATGWAVTTKVRVPSSPNVIPNISTGAGCHAWLQIMDGTKTIAVAINEYFLVTGASTTNDFVVQGDFKSQERVITLCGKGSDYYLFLDGKLAVDGTGKLSVANGTNVIYFGDSSLTASENADAIWSYVKYYQGGMILPTAGSNTCSEFAHWSGDKSALLPSLWNSGTPISVKQLCGVPRNYQFEQVVQKLSLRGVTSAPTSTSATATVVPEMEGYLIGQDISGFANLASANSVAGNYVSLQTQIDGALSDSAIVNTPVAGYVSQVQSLFDTGKLAARPRIIGLQKVEARWSISGGTQTAQGKVRNLTVEARS